ncbi:alpha/beta fold hydrolase [Glycomyces rhizosphaerae]|uniref:Alpha/beta fold hydrolase n=1 Tax=Glycomyces rhizosphaerae TaxID=2054422 RepID=A0ABV7PWD5_9ACTN
MPDGTITLPDTTIDYDLRGDGPPLLLIPGGSGDAGVMGPLAKHLADSYTVISVYSRLASRREHAAELGDQYPASAADDALHLLDKLTDEPVNVFGFSAGAIAAVELTLRHPERVRAAVVHEALMTHFLPDAEAQQAMFTSVRDTARTGDMAAAGKIMTEGVTAPQPEVSIPLRHFGTWLDGYADTEPEPPAPELAPVFARLAGLQPAFIEHVLVPFTSHVPDPDALRAAADRLVPAAGIDSRGQLPHRTVAAFAASLDLPLTEFPGGHLGAIERPRQFAEALTALLEIR